jgi:hypothetical protein
MTGAESLACYRNIESQNTSVFRCSFRHHVMSSDSLGKYRSNSEIVYRNLVGLKESQESFQSTQSRCLDIDTFSFGIDRESFQGLQVVHTNIAEVGFLILVFCDIQTGTGDSLFESGGKDLDSECGFYRVVFDVGRLFVSNMTR